MLKSANKRNVVYLAMPVFIALVVSLLYATQATAQSADPLPSWNDREVKKAIIHFVARVTTMGSPDFVPAEQRIATFDQDGTLWSEQPVVQGLFLMYQLERMVEKDPSLRAKQPFKAALEHDKTYLKNEGMSAIIELFAATHSGMSQEQFELDVETFFAEAKYPPLGVPVGQVVYEPMIELLNFLRANNFMTYICSGGGIDFMRILSNRLYGIPPEQVIGTSMKKELHLVDGKWELSRTGELDSFNDKEVKPVNIDLHIGTRPLLAKTSGLMKAPESGLFTCQAYRISIA